MPRRRAVPGGACEHRDSNVEGDVGGSNIAVPPNLAPGVFTPTPASPVEQENVAALDAYANAGDLDLSLAPRDPLEPDMGAYEERRSA